MGKPNQLFSENGKATGVLRPSSTFSTFGDFIPVLNFLLWSPHIVDSAKFFLVTQIGELNLTCHWYMFSCLGFYFQPSLLFLLQQFGHAKLCYPSFTLWFLWHSNRGWSVHFLTALRKLWRRSSSPVVIVSSFPTGAADLNNSCFQAPEFSRRSSEVLSVTRS